MKKKLLVIIQNVLIAADGKDPMRQAALYRLGFQALKEIIQDL